VKQNAAREAAEESLNVFGSADELEKYLRYTKGFQMYHNCFLVNLGQMSDLDRNHIVDLFNHRRWDPSARLSSSELEIVKLRWFSAEGSN
jgi:hypothetical protein